MVNMSVAPVTIQNIKVAKQYFASSNYFLLYLGWAPELEGRVRRLPFSFNGTWVYLVIQVFVIKIVRRGCLMNEDELEQLTSVSFPILWNRTNPDRDGVTSSTACTLRRT